MIVRLLLSGFIFACSAAIALAIAQMICSRIEAFPDGPRRVNLHPAVPLIFMVALGLILAARGANALQLATVALLGVPLVGAWYADSHTGIIPDLFTLVPLAVIGIFVIVQHSWFIAVWAIVTFAAFAFAALLSRGRGMGWGDAKLAGVAGAVLGIPWSFGVLGVACLAATIASVIRDRGTRPIAFGPYISVAVLVAIAFMVHA